MCPHRELLVGLVDSQQTADQDFEQRSQTLQIPPVEIMDTDKSK